MGTCVISLSVSFVGRSTDKQKDAGSISFKTLKSFISLKM